LKIHIWEHLAIKSQPGLESLKSIRAKYGKLEQ